MISRYDRSRNVNFEIELGSRGLGEVGRSRAPAARRTGPAGQRAPDRRGRRGDDGRAVRQLGLAMLTGVVYIYIVLVLLLKDFLQPVTILAALPLSLGGAFVAARRRPELPCRPSSGSPDGHRHQAPSCWWNTPSSRAAPAWSGCMRCWTPATSAPVPP